MRILTTAAIVITFAFCLVAETPAERAWGILDAGVKEKSTALRLHAVLALGLLTANAKARGMAEAALKDPKGEVRAAAAAALGDMNAISICNALEEGVTQHVRR